MDYQDVIAKRDLGISRAIQGAVNNDPEWFDAAYIGLLRFTMRHEDPFLTEDVRAWSEQHGYVLPPENARAWGAVMRSAAKNGLIQKVGYRPAKSSNLSPKVLWEAI